MQTQDKRRFVAKNVTVRPNKGNRNEDIWMNTRKVTANQTRDIRNKVKYFSEKVDIKVSAMFGLKRLGGIHAFLSV